MSIFDETRIENDSLGARNISNDVYYGIHTLRAVENFSGISRASLSEFPEFINALASVKEAAALANRDLGVLDGHIAGCIAEACREVSRGLLRDQFPVDMIQGGAGTSTNMNINEVVANRALELYGKNKGQYEHISPLDHVNRGQSTNDVYPTAIRIAVRSSLEPLQSSLEALGSAFRTKAAGYDDTLKLGRTQLQDAVPMTVGQEFRAFAHVVERDSRLIAESDGPLRSVNLGGTAIGTGINGSAGYAEKVVEVLGARLDRPVHCAADLVASTQDVGPLIQASSHIKAVAIDLSKICNDLRLLSSGPRGGFGELVLPAVQAGSSIMPGKINPVIPEAVNQIAFAVIGNDATVSAAGEAGQLQLNAFEPVIVYRILESARMLTLGCTLLKAKCVDDLLVNKKVSKDNVLNSLGLATVLSPYIGYARASRVAKEASEHDCRVIDVVRKHAFSALPPLDEVLSPANMT